MHVVGQLQSGCLDGPNFLAYMYIILCIFIAGNSWLWTTFVKKWINPIHLSPLKHSWLFLRHQTF